MTFLNRDPPKVRTVNPSGPFAIRLQSWRSRGALRSVSMSTLHTSTSPKSLAKQLQAREAVLLIFCDPLPEQYARLWHLSDNEWQQLLRWLATSGLALYFLDRDLGLT